MGRNVDGLKASIKNLKGIEVDGETKGEVLEHLNALLEAEVDLTIAVVDGSETPISSPTVALKKGLVVGEGDAISKTSNVYKVKFGIYNYMISAEGYLPISGVIKISGDVADKNVTVEMKPAAADLYIDIKDIAEAPIEGAEVVLKTGNVIGSGDVVTAKRNGNYAVHYGSFNYSVYKAGYATETGIITVTAEDVALGEKEVEIIIELANVALTIAVEDESQAPITDAAIVLKTGSTLGEGDVVDAEADGSYVVNYGSYNYSVTKETYDVETGVITISAEDTASGSKTVTAVLTLTN